ncbi:hypothetical protein LRB11_17515, partial [Ectothiorhodospira haloalkaliphila]|uniref:hypothetical protein n=1 Tax=Ectothiorhodospira haloalkaliphila TaxID=421628 RepID=UPI001EE80B32
SASPLYGKRRLLVFNNKGMGPCRQGQYVETHKLLFHRDTGPLRDQVGEDEVEDLLRFLVGLEDQGFDVGLQDGVAALHAGRGAAGGLSPAALRGGGLLPRHRRPGGFARGISGVDGD